MHWLTHPALGVGGVPDSDGTAQACGFAPTRKQATPENRMDALLIRPSKKKLSVVPMNRATNTWPLLDNKQRLARQAQMNTKGQGAPMTTVMDDSTVSVTLRPTKARAY